MAGLNSPIEYRYNLQTLNVINYEFIKRNRIHSVLNHHVHGLSNPWCISVGTEQAFNQAHQVEESLHPHSWCSGGSDCYFMPHTILGWRRVMGEISWPAPSLNHLIHSIPLPY